MKRKTELEATGSSAVVFIHGQPGSESDFSDLVPRLPQEVTTVTYDRPGWGRNPNDATDLDGNVKYLVEEVLGDRFEKVILVGYSYGSAVALKAAVDYPQRVGGLILVAPVGSTESISSVDMLLVVATRFLKVFPVHSMLRRKKGSGRAAIESFHSEQIGLSVDLDKLSRVIPAIEHRVELIAGTDDLLNPLKGTLWLHDTLPNSRLTLLKDVGHLLTTQAPANIASKIFDMWSDQVDRRE